MDIHSSYVTWIDMMWLTNVNIVAYVMDVKKYNDDCDVKVMVSRLLRDGSPLIIQQSTQTQEENFTPRIAHYISTYTKVLRLKKLW